jgi:hypothetical protein
VKPNINKSVEVHPQLSNNGHPVDGALMGAGSPWLQESWVAWFPSLIQNMVRHMGSPLTRYCAHMKDLLQLLHKGWVDLFVVHLKHFAKCFMIKPWKNIF